MRRADRLMTIVQLLRDGRMRRAVDIARIVGVTERTVYRDMQTLAASGVPVEGARGIGYRVTAAITLPPLNLSLTEVEALHLGLSAVGATEDIDLSRAARSLLAKLDAVLPEDRGTPDPTQFAIYPFADAAKGFQHLPPLRQAIRSRQKVQITLAGKVRNVRPLKLDYWGRLWTCIVWCETSRGFDDLRVDQITALPLLPGLFVVEPGKSLADYHESRTD